MKKFFKVISTIIAAVCCFGVFASCGAGETITVGYTDYAPMNYTNEAGELVGFDTELAKKTFEDLGYKVRFKEIDCKTRGRSDFLRKRHGKQRK